jgi:hypothetical protein
MWDDVDRQRQMRVLEAAGMAQASEELLDVAELARELSTSEPVIRMDIGQLHALGLVLDGLREGLPPILPRAGRQFLARDGDADHDVLGFLPRVIDDLNAREALLVAGTLVVDEFRVALLRGAAVEHAQQLVPPAFITAVDDRLALDLFAAAVALMARLSDGAPAGCVAEEIMSVGLMEERITTCSPSAWRCSTLARMASGAVAFVRFRNTAVPGTRCTGGVRSRISSMNSRNGPSSCSRRSVTSRRPRCHVVRIVNAVTAISSGSHAPCTNLVRFAARNSRSTVSNGAAPSTTSHSGVPQRWRAM